MTDSILDSTKKALGLGADYDVFDLDIMTHINGVFLNLNQLGIGPLEGFEIEDAEAVWKDFVGAEASPLLNAIKPYVYLKVRLAFDPPQTSFHIESIERQIREFEFRLSVLRDELNTTTVVLVPPVLPSDDYEDIDGGGADLP